jgi:hypothetical protein
VDGWRYTYVLAGEEEPSVLARRRLSTFRVQVPGAGDAGAEATTLSVLRSLDDDAIPLDDGGRIKWMGSRMAVKCAPQGWR